ALFAKGKFSAGITSLLVKNIPVSLTYDAEGATITQDGAPVQAPVQYREGRVTALAVAEREEYSFEKWELGAHAYEDAADVYSMTLCAVFSENQYKITYTGGGTADNPKGYSLTTPTFTLATPVREGYTFLGWTGTDLEEQTMEVTVEAGSTGNRQYTAHWQANIYHLTLDAAGGEIDVRELDVAFGSSFWITTPKRNGYTLGGWKMADGTDFPASNIWNIAEDVTLTAEWIKIDYAISYSLGGVPASNSNPVVYDVETESITLKDLSYPNCTFLGWYSDAAYTNRVTSIPKGSWGPKTLYAKWYIPTFNVILDLNGGYGISQQVITYSALDLPLSIADLLPQKDLHTFYYWAKDALDGVPVDTISACSDVLLVANYLPAYTQIQIVTDQDSGARRCQARYWVTSGSAVTPPELRFPKYHRLKDFTESPYIQIIYLATPTGFGSISFSEEVLKVEGNLEQSSIKGTVYDGGSYVGSRENPYFMLVGNAPGTMPGSIHPETRQIYSFSNPTLTRLTIPQNVQKIHKDAFSKCHISYVRNLSPAIKIVAGSTDNGAVASGAAIAYNAPADRDPDGYFTEGDFCFYTEAPGNYVLVAFMGDGTVTDVALPETVKGVSSYKLGAYAFMGYKNIECVKFPVGVTEIGNGAFHGCSSLATIEHAEPFTAIGTNAFEGCKALLVKPTAP
ncbi:MAG: InlB B-repeat-containing protein, partial [Clostridia bacterium]|nr:InlB B-repeat-containing protein [Clostridia bacterium]